MSARTFVPASPADERGIALLTTILMMVLMSALLVGFTTAVMSDQGYRAIDRDRARAFYGAQSGIEKLNADLARLFVNQVGPTRCGGDRPRRARQPADHPERHVRGRRRQPGLRRDAARARATHRHHLVGTLRGTDGAQASVPARRHRPRRSTAAKCT